MTFYLQHGIKDNPNGWHEPATFLDSRKHPGCEQLAEIVAANWIEASLEAQNVYYV